VSDAARSESVLYAHAVCDAAARDGFGPVPAQSGRGPFPFMCDMHPSTLAAVPCGLRAGRTARRNQFRVQRGCFR
jgi:hypothetical protein